MARSDRAHGDAHWMRRALRLARRRAGRTWPNPTVGACIVREGRLLAEAAHRAAGEDHAEAAALRSLRERGLDPAGSTLYVTLEPCHHRGRTPPCSRAIAEAGIARVVYAIGDVSPRQHGGGAAWLASQGIRVEAGPFAREAWELNHPFFETRSDDEVHLTLKLALSLDGRVAPREGRIEDPEARRVTGERAHRRVHRMRASAGAILVGRRTVAYDRPRLDVRHVPARDRPEPAPRPVVLDPRLTLDPAWLPAGALVLAAEETSPTPSHGSWEVVGVATSAPGRLAWDAVAEALAARGLGVVLVEAGPTLAADLLANARPHRIHLFLAPRVFGAAGPSIPPLPALESRYRSWRARRVGGDVEWILRRDDLPGPPPF